VNAPFLEQITDSPMPARPLPAPPIDYKSVVAELDRLQKIIDRVRLQVGLLPFVPLPYAPEPDLEADTSTHD
jgi:hypothetical protein